MPHATSPLHVLSKAVQQACRTLDAGEWLVREYEDDLFRVSRAEGRQAEVLIETLR